MSCWPSRASCTARSFSPVAKAHSAVGADPPLAALHKPPPRQPRKERYSHPSHRPIDEPHRCEEDHKQHEAVQHAVNPARSPVMPLGPKPPGHHVGRPEQGEEMIDEDAFAEAA